MATHYRSSSKRIVALPSGLGVIPSYKRAEIIMILINNLIKWDFAEKSGKDGTCSPLNPSISAAIVFIPGCTRLISEV